MMDITDFSLTRPPRARALIPFGVFLLFYLGLSIVSGDFYKVPMPIAFIVASATALVLDHKSSLKSKIELFAHGMGNVDIMTMCLIFILAGSFAYTAKAMGAVDAAVNIALAFVPANLLVCGLFLVACFISISIGTSVGTIVALAPIAIGLTESVGISLGLCLGSVVGGAMFGDNLSMISDTTIAATRTQNVEMRDKFRSNIRIAIPAALLTIVVYLILGHSGTSGIEHPIITWKSCVAVLPYLTVLVLAVLGVNVMALLIFGTVFAGVIGMVNGAFSFWNFLDVMGKGALSMSETLIVALLAGGLLRVIRYNGGIDFIISRMTRHVSGKRGAEFSIAALVSIANLCTANNTIAIITTGPIAKDIAVRFHLDRRKTASILDTFSCLVQGIIPYGAQMLIAAGLAGISPLSIIGNLYYPFCMGTCAILAILIRYPRKYSGEG